MCLEHKLSGSDLWPIYILLLILIVSGQWWTFRSWLKGKTIKKKYIKFFQCNYKTFPGNVTFSEIFNVFSMCLEKESFISMVFQDVWEPWVLHLCHAVTFLKLVWLTFSFGGVFHQDVFIEFVLIGHGVGRYRNSVRICQSWKSTFQERNSLPDTFMQTL